MIGTQGQRWGRAGDAGTRRGAAAVEFATCLPVLILTLTGLWEVGRITQIQAVLSNAAREAARDASLGQDNLQTVASNLLTYLQAADRTAFPPSHATSMRSPVITMPSNTTGYTCWDTTANRELFTITFADLTATSVTDPTGMSQLDLYRLGISVPYSSVAFSSLASVTGTSRISSSVVWASMVDSPFQIAPYLPAQ